MARLKPLNAKQLAVIDDLFKGKKEQEILEKHNINRKLYYRWLADENFKRWIDMLIGWEYRLNEMILAREVRQAVTNLIKLTESEQPETARKACIDIITMRDNLPSGKSSDNPIALPADNPKLLPESMNFSPETAGKVLAVFAEEKTIGTS
jgi:hypothetical protein